MSEENQTTQDVQTLNKRGKSVVAQNVRYNREILANRNQEINQKRSDIYSEKPK